MSPLDLLTTRSPDLLTRIISVACSDRELPALADDLASLVVRSATGLTFCDVYVLDEEGRALECGGRAPVALGEGVVGWVAAHGRPRRHDDLRGATLPVRVPDGGTIAVVDVRSGAPCLRQDLELAEALAALFAPVLCSCRRLRTAREREHSAERFADQAVQVQEAERARLAGEIHDGLAQRLASLGFHLSAAARLLPRHHEEAHDQIVLARELCELAAAETRAAIGGLRPPVLDDLGLSAALATLAREAGTRQKSLDVTVAVSGELEAPLPGHLQTALYRIAQEAVGNCLRHAAAGCLDIVLELERDRVVLTVVDDGAGFSIADVFAPGRRPDSYGLRGMAERAELLGGRTTVTSRPDEGTAVRAVLPLPGPLRDPARTVPP
ncbi:histidine kinase [Actinomadura scrupuli]|uniref:GAF domain-containing sensor histidine kinase n=1 Tax=Actinomadura scrupuli TaxID=559629 RepID=UPI003D973319